MLRQSGSAGFTLLEVLVALSVTAVIAAAAYSVFATASDLQRSVAVAQRQGNRAANEERLLRALAANLVTPTPDAPFSGLTNDMKFTSWCAAAAGWLEQCRATLRIEAGVASLAVEDMAGASVSYRLSWPERPLQLLYLASAEGQGQWLYQWGMSLRAPLAFGIARAGDTVLVRFGGL